MGGEGAGLTEQLVDQGGLAVVNVGDNGDISEGAGHSGLGVIATRKKPKIITRPARRID
jgi:hypothetical protein